MARKKVTLAYITNDATRRATLKKRRRGLMKKVNELSTLCGVPTCAVVYAPHEDKPEVFPSLEEAKKIFTDLESMPEIDKNKKMVNQMTFLQQRLLKLNQQVRRLEHENKELASAIRLRQCLNGNRIEISSQEDADALLELIDRRSKAVQTRLHQLGAPPTALGLPVPHLAVENFDLDSAAIEEMLHYSWLGCGGSGGAPVMPSMMDYGHGAAAEASGLGSVIIHDVPALL